VVHEPDELRGRFALASVQQRRAKLKESDQTLRDAPDRSRQPARLRDAGALMRERGDREGEMRVYREVLALDP
jgi:hypothetical protein